jgi:hypothetical protein
MGKNTMAGDLNAIERGNNVAQITSSFAPCPLAMADRDRREALRDPHTLTAAFLATHYRECLRSISTDEKSGLIKPGAN